MAFGKKHSAPANNYQDENGGNGKQVFFPTASGEKGVTVTHTFRMFPDVEGREETEVLALEWRGQVKVNGRDTYRSMLVRKDNPNDTAQWDAMNAIDATEGLSDEDKAEAKKPYRQKLSKRIFFINVYNVDLGIVQVLKGTWEEHVEDDAGNIRPKSPRGGKSIYAKLLAKIRTGARVKDPNVKLKSITITDPAKFEMTFSISGEGMGKNYEFGVGAVEDIDPELLELPRYKLEDWVSDGVGIWPNEAVAKVLAGHDFYEVQKEYGVVLYPELEVLETVSDSAGDDDTDSLFEE